MTVMNSLWKSLFPSIAVVGLDKIVEDLLLLVGHVVNRIVSTAHVRPMRGSGSVILYVGHVECL